ncbi:hypothetical protein [Tenacibaculum sp. Bg11-29]|uniref:hypothetical protein n=1 Tax=Tenacibaculum sp. Bg11-29 TaxID=2058306 RepID=UPI0018E37186|nr:hypothetical protein [Tenacibaculum sp. Bg11-29]
MKKIILTSLFIAVLSILSCSTGGDDLEETDLSETNLPETRTEWRCGTHNGKKLWTGPKGGCYYKNSNGNKTYVDRSECNC